LLSINLFSSVIEYQQKAHKLKLSESRYWNLLLHNVEGVSEIDDDNFFFAKDGKYNARHELDANIEAFFNETTFEDESASCKFPARKLFIKEKLNINNFPKVTCTEYKKILKRINPKSATLVFPSAHINSPASMFGHTFLRIDSEYDSKLLSYAVNYAADANTATENGFVFAIKGLFGGYYGKYSLLPYYDKLKEYRDSEQRDMWEYDLDLNEEEVLRMFSHIWELNGTHSDYYFFTENCSYNILWFIEVARESIHLRDKFRFQVIPIATVHEAKELGILKNKTEYRPSRRTILLAYEKIIDKKYIDITIDLSNFKVDVKDILNNKNISKKQKIYIIEAAIELVEYKFSKSKIEKDKYLQQFHDLSKARASLGQAEKLKIDIPQNPIDGHRDLRVNASLGTRDDDFIQMLGIRPAYHDLKDSNYGFLRGTQIEFMDFLLSNSEGDIEVEKATLISISSIAQRSDFFTPFSWRLNLGWDRKSLDDSSHFVATLGGGMSWGNENGYIYFMLDPLAYIYDGVTTGIGGSIGFAFDKYSFMNTNFEITNRFYETGDEQLIVEFTQGFRVSKNIQIQFNYDYKQRVLLEDNNEQTYTVNLNYYF